MWSSEAARLHRPSHFPYRLGNADEYRAGHDGMTDVELLDFGSGRHRGNVPNRQPMPGVNRQAKRRCTGRC